MPIAQRLQQPEHVDMGHTVPGVLALQSSDMLTWPAFVQVQCSSDCGPAQAHMCTPACQMCAMMSASQPWLSFCHHSSVQQRRLCRPADRHVPA